MGRNRFKYPKPPTALQGIEEVWSGPMANSLRTRIRFAIWQAMDLAAKMAEKTSKTAASEIKRELGKERSRYDESGHRLFHG